MEIRIENITWNFQPLSKWDEERLGLAYVGIPENMMKRFIKECRWKEDLKVPPHYYEEDLETLDGNHECYNSDTQIVLMNWLHDKKRNYKLDYRGSDPFWVYHDHCHSQGDVYNYEVGSIYASTEHYRIIEGGEMAKHYGIYIQPQTIVDIIGAWDNRFRNESVKIHLSDFETFMKKKDYETVNELLSY
jgi:hypothetical protein